MEKVVAFVDLPTADLIVDAVYEGGVAKNAGDDPVNKLLPVGNAGGIRSSGSKNRPRVVALITSGENMDWPDSIDVQTGILTYFGDNRTPGRELHDTPKHGNEILRNAFDASHGDDSRSNVPPFLVFAKANRPRDYRFLGLAVPGSANSSFVDDLVGVWRSANGVRYQNYKATLTILDVGRVRREWIVDILEDRADSKNAPSPWLSWRNGSSAKALRAPRTIEHRTKLEQEPETKTDRQIVAAVHSHFVDRPFDFEAFAADLVRTYLPDVVSLDVTRRSRDGGRDAIGLYRVGSGGGQILLDFSMEAKCYKPGNSVGVKELSRLISRLRHRQFGVLVTTSHLDLQAYKELKEDAHPIVVIAGGDMARILRASSQIAENGISAWLCATYPVDAARPGL
jgi:hypothetical protein